MIEPVKSVAIIGATGFVGQHLVAEFSKQRNLSVHFFGSKSEANRTVVDITSEITWHHLVKLKPDILIDASGYGIVKTQSDLTSMYAINYIKKAKFATFIFKNLPHLFWVQIGTAFEYGLDQTAITEESYCLPETHYGISKLMFSTFLKEKIRERYCIMRPFAMFGEWEDHTKLIPLLIRTQKQQNPVALSDGKQYRDYFYVNDLASFLLKLILNGRLQELESEVINIGSGIPRTIREISQTIATRLPNFDEKLWGWGQIPQRTGEPPKFYNASEKARQNGFTCTPLETALIKTIAHYIN